MRTVAVIPARAGSKRLPGKNVRPFMGKPLINWSVEFALSYPSFDRVLVSTDSPEIADLARQAGVDVPWLRPADIAGDAAKVVDAALHALRTEREAGREYDLLALLQPTTPFRRARRWQAAYALLEERDCDAVVGVRPAATHPLLCFDWSNPPVLKPILDVRNESLRSQDLPPAVAIAGNLYLVRTKVLERERTFFPGNIAGVLCDDPVEAIDIDAEVDWVVAEALANHFGLVT